VQLTPFSSVLVANRGEIACRILKTCRAMGLRTIAVYSDADADAPHVALADEAVRLGEAPAAESYLRVDRILEAARSTGAEAIHPGYGFLSENADFAQAVADAGLVFIGPRPETIRQMGSKAGARALMASHGVPVVPGYSGAQDDAAMAAAVAAIGLPVLIKSSAGGGGKGMSIVRSLDALPAALASARRTALAAFGDDTLLLERYVEAPRHVEVQIFGDRHGHAMHLFERECSVQRRFQKVIEESPSPASQLSAAIRERLCEAGVRAARALGYEGAGTVEFLLDADGGFYFLEVNTRLQVEHPVTELVTGLDLVRLQLLVAMGGALTELVPHLDRRADQLAARAAQQLSERATRESAEMREVIEGQRAAIEQARDRYEQDAAQLVLDLPGVELRQRQSERRFWDERLRSLALEVESEPARIRGVYEVKTVRVEPAGLVYLWPMSR